MTIEDKIKFFVDETNGYIKSLENYSKEQKAQGNLEKSNMAEDRVYGMEIIKQLFEITFSTNGN